MNRRHVLGWTLLLCLLWTGSGVVAQAEEPIRIGFIAPFSGPYGAGGDDGLRALLLKVEEVNASGGVLGRTLEIVTADDQCGPELAGAAALQLIEQGVVAAVGPYCSAATSIASEMFSALGGIPIISPSSDLATLTERGLDNFFRTVGRNDEQGRIAALFMVDELGASRIAIVHDATMYSAVLASEAGRAARALGAEVVYHGRIEAGSGEYDAAVSAIAGAAPDVVYFTGYYNDGPVLLRGLRAAGVEAAFVAGDSNSNPAFLQASGEAAEGVFVTSPPLPRYLESAREFEAAFRAAYGTDPHPYSAYAYDALAILLKAIEAAGTTDAAALRQALRSVTLEDGVTGTVRFDAKGDRIGVSYVVLQVQSGAFTPYGWQSAQTALESDRPFLYVNWLEWPPCHLMRELAAEYDAAEVYVDCLDIGDWHEHVFSDFEGGTGADVLILDSQWVGEAVVGGHLLELTEWMEGRIDKSAFVPVALSSYGEYPAGSGRYYGLPWMADTQVLLYRKDLFAAAGFKPPATWSELLALAEDFTAGDLVPYGYTTFWCGDVECYDMIQSVWNQLAWSWGGELWEPETMTIDGVINSPQNVEALRFAKRLFEAGPPEAIHYQFGDVVRAFCSGEVAMATVWFGNIAGLGQSEDCAHYGDLGYAVVPGEVRHVISLGGQGVHVSAYSRNKEAALAFVEWLQREETQLKWAKLGGYPAQTAVLASEAFREAQPFNSVFAESYVLSKDFWNMPEYDRLLVPQGLLIKAAILGEIDAKDALDEIARQQQAILDAAYSEE